MTLCTIAVYNISVMQVKVLNWPDTYLFFQKLKRRTASVDHLHKEETKKAALELLHIDYMSSEGTDSEAESERRKNRTPGPKPRKVKKLSWESPLAAKIKSKLDRAYLKKVARHDHISRMAKVSRSRDATSNRQAPVNCPEWIMTSSV